MDSAKGAAGKVKDKIKHHVNSVAKTESEDEVPEDQSAAAHEEGGDHEVVSNIEKKVDDRLHALEESTQRKVDEFFKMMREAYGVPFGAHSASAPAGAGPGVGSDAQPWEGAKVKFHLPDLPPGKHAVIQLEQQKPVAAGGEVAANQKEAMGALLKRMDTLMGKISGAPAAAEKESLGSEEAAPPGSLSDLFNKVKAIKDNLGGLQAGSRPRGVSAGPDGSHSEAWHGA
jgi:hypothetical protein